MYLSTGTELHNSVFWLAMVSTAVETFLLIFTEIWVHNNTDSHEEKLKIKLSSSTYEISYLSPNAYFFCLLVQGTMFEMYNAGYPSCVKILLISAQFARESVDSLLRPG